MQHDIASSSTKHKESLGAGNQETGRIHEFSPIGTELHSEDPLEELINELNDPELLNLRDLFGMC